jgi:hypothetical protein
MRVGLSPIGHAALASSLVGLACSGSYDPGVSGGVSAGAPICATNTFELIGSLGGATANGFYAGPTSYAFVNALSAAVPGSLDLQFGSAGAMDLQWSVLAADDRAVPATGIMTMPAEGPNATLTYCVTGSITPRAAGGVSFAFSSIGAGVCPGTPVSGSLRGCASP